MADALRFVSTRGAARPRGFSDALLAGLAEDGGLFVPERFPTVDRDAVAEAPSFAAAAERVLRPFLAGDRLEAHVATACRAAFDFPVPLVPLDRETAVLELFHGPTAAFKDFGARFLAACLEAVPAPRGRPWTVLVATSGDTGGAVAAAFHGRRGVRVAVLYPRGGVSPLQERQLVGWGDNVRAFAVDGTFDACQRAVKDAFADAELGRTRNLVSANSINVGRLLPQAAYHAWAATRPWSAAGQTPGLIVPTGNLGNAVAAFWARHLGFPIRRIVLATNANRTIADWMAGGDWAPRPSVRTLANAMDVGDPSNSERLFSLHPERERLREITSAVAVDDEDIRRTLTAGPSRWGRVWCPHTATAVRARELEPDGRWVVVATAHPGKFAEIVEPCIGRAVELPPALEALASGGEAPTPLSPGLAALRPHLLAEW